ncbi:NAD(P)-binding domain-containing protein [Ilumatobacter sp.]|uniref:NAD(P)-binding domain-containing protein n=1 Tax=Ilumatobacter sp. TaxID=1967498 RepID=UPI003C40957F
MDTPDPSIPTQIYDLVIIGGTAGGLSTAVSSLRSGLRRVRIIESSSRVALPDLIGPNQLDVGFGETVASIDVGGDHLIVDTDRLSYRTRAVLVADRRADTSWIPPIPIPDSPRVHLDAIGSATDQDVLVVGLSDHAVELTAQLVDGGNRVVLAAAGMDPSRLSPAAERALRALERGRQATLLYRSSPQHITFTGEYPMVEFGDRRTPDLQFDQVVFASPRQVSDPADVGVTASALDSGKVWFLGDPGDDRPETTAPGWQVGLAMAEALFPEVEVAPPRTPHERRTQHVGAIEELRHEHYNATITHFEPTHSDLWVLRVKPDQGDTSYLPGQYASLGLGYWEERIDDAPDPEADTRWDKLIRRSYSISSRMFDDHGYLTDENGLDELEFYIVLVAPTPDNTPALTPRLALKRDGDRIYLGPKVAGRYTLKSVIDPRAEIVFFSTGTGEAPHNGMVIDLLRKGHTGPIISAVTVRESADLGYADKHRELESRYANYHYLPMPTREPGIPKRYLQDLLRDDDFGSKLGVQLSPSSSHVFLCGNPAMIGLPEEVDGVTTFPETTGVVELLAEQGFTLDRRNAPGNIHYEEYW